jgi:hypothetical protein
MMMDAQQKPTPQAGGPAVKEGETFGILHITVRENYVVPQAITVEEGWYRIAVDDPSRVGAGAIVNLHDERGNALTGKALAAQGPKTSFHVRLGPGKQQIRVGAKSQWVVQVTVNAATKK